MKSTLRRTWAQIDLDALAHNYQTLCRQMGGKSRFLGVVKGDAYGHGAIQISQVLQELGAEYLGVSSVDEACELRLGGIRIPVLLLGITPANQAGILTRFCLTQAVYSEDMAAKLSSAALAAGGKVKVHIKLDTGMSRLGFLCDEASFADSLAAICRIAAFPGLEVEGIFTHFSVSDEQEETDYTMLQHDRFAAMLLALRERGITFRYCHCANSGATANYPQFSYDLFRPGILTYGIGPDAKKLGLKPVMTLKTVVGAEKEYPEGTSIGYGRTFRAERPMRVGILPIGYADGLHRSLSNNWQVWTPYGTAPIVGRICMDMCMVDLTDLPEIREGMEVEVFGVHNSVDDAAERAGTISYELTCDVTKRVPRVYCREGRERFQELLLRGFETV